MTDVAIRFRTEGADEAKRAFTAITQSAQQANDAAKSAASAGGGPGGFNLKELQDFNKQLESGLPASKTFHESLSAIGERAAALAGPVATAAAAIGLLGVKMGLTGLHEAENMRILSEKTNMSVESLSRLKYVAEQASIPFETLTRASASLQRVLQGGAKGSVGGAKGSALAALGVDVDALKKMQPEQQLVAIANGLQSITDKNEQLGRLEQIFGVGAGSGLLAFFRQSPEAIAATAAELDKFGGVINSATAADAERFYNALNSVGTALGNVKKNIAADLAPALRGIAEALKFLASDSGALKALTVVLSALAQILLFLVRTVVTVLVSVTAVFTDLSNAIGGIYAATALMAKGDFKGAWSAFGEALDRIKKGGAETTQALKGLWNLLERPVPNIAEEVDKANKGLDKLQKNAFNTAAGFRAMYASWQPMAASFQQADFIKTGPTSGAWDSEGNPKSKWFPERNDFNDLLLEVRGFARDFTDEINNMLWESETSWEDYFKSIGKMITRIILQQTIARPLENALGDIVTKIFGSMSGAAPSPNPEPASTTAAAGGGIIPSGSWGLVGEVGPELIGPVGHARQVIPNDQLGGITINQSFAPGVTRADLASILVKWKTETIAAVADINRRGMRA